MKNKKSIIMWACLVLIIFIVIYSHLNYCIISFDTDSGSNISPIRVKKGETIKFPNDPKKNGYVFVEWRINNKKVSKNKKVNTNLKLTAYYLPEIYHKVSFNTDGGTNLSSIKILSGNKILKKELKTPQKKGYNFEGWYYNDKPFDFNTKIVDDILLTAHYSKAGTFISYSDIKIGDEVLIIGDYASSTYDKYAYNSKAIGWNRKVLKIYKDTNFPYQIGNDYGTTGFFKKESIKVIK